MKHTGYMAFTIENLQNGNVILMHNYKMAQIFWQQFSPKKI
jgi:hypothetical protein